MPPTLQHSLNYSSLRSVHISPKWALRKCPLESSSSTKQNPSPRPSDDAYHTSLRVVRSEERWTVKRQLTKQATAQSTHWVWLTTCSPAQVRTEQIVHLAHLRWDIENHGFNELVNGWHADHVYRHQPQAVECFLLLAFLAYNLFHAFFALNLKPQLRRGRTMAFLVELIAAELHVLPRFSRITAPP